MPCVPHETPAIQPYVGFAFFAIQYEIGMVIGMVIGMANPGTVTLTKCDHVPAG